MCGQLKFQMPARPPIGRPDRTYLRHPTGGAGARWCSGPWTKAHSSPAASTQEPPSDRALQSPRGACPARLTVPACAPPCVLPHDRSALCTTPRNTLPSALQQLSGSTRGQASGSAGQLPAQGVVRVLVPHQHTDTSHIPPFSFQLPRAESRVSLWGFTHTAGPGRVTEYASLAQRGGSIGVERAALLVQSRRTDGHTLTPRPHKQPRSLRGERDAARHKQEMPRQLGDRTKTMWLGCHLSGGSHTRRHSRESLLPLQPGATGAADKGSPKVCPQFKGKKQQESTCLTKTSDWWIISFIFKFPFFQGTPKDYL